jgi:lipopolysaccharide/colanic/teichoic acid biosynthesis glycosyltransferase
MKRRSIVINTIIDIAGLTLAFLLMIWIKPASVRVYLPTYLYPFFIFLFIWIAISLIARKYSAPERLKLSRALWHILFTNLIITGIATILMFAIKTNLNSRIVVLGTISLGTVFEFIFAVCDYFVCNAKPGPDTSKVFEVYQKVVGRIHEIPVAEPLPIDSISRQIPENIKDAIVEESNEDVFDFLSEHIDLNLADYSLLSTTSRFNVDKLPEKAYHKIVNLTRINDIRYINKFLESVNRKLPNQGVFIGCFESKNQRKERILKKFPPILNSIYYFFDFIVKRVFPKFNLTKGIYFFLTRGDNRVLSKAEMFGRLYSCGFEIVLEKNIQGWLYFVSRKIREPYYDAHPTYGPLIKLRRIGKNGKIINVYKFRTMHPFAEYLQEYVYNKSDLDKGGKFKDDFRVTTLGRFFRKFWLDEFPMFINLFSGDMKLFGVRPLSEHYFSLYSRELQEKRIKTKPGLIPPFYVDLPKTLDEIQASEMKYLDAYEKHPLLTDFKYFWKAVWNIVFKQARSS